MTKSAVDVYKIHREVFEYYYVQKLPTLVVCQKIEEKFPELKPFGKNKLMGLTFRFRKLWSLPLPVGYIGNLRVVFTPESENFVKYAFEHSHDVSKLRAYAKNVKVYSMSIRVDYQLRKTQNTQNTKHKTQKSFDVSTHFLVSKLDKSQDAVADQDDQLLSVEKEDLTQTKKPIFKHNYRRPRVTPTSTKEVTTGVDIYDAKMKRQPPILPEKYNKDDNLDNFPNHVLNKDVVGCRRILTVNKVLYACNSPLKASARKLFCASCLTIFAEKSRYVKESLT